MTISRRKNNQITLISLSALRNVAPRTVAEQLTLIEYQLFSAVPIAEMFTKTFLDHGKAPRYSEIVRRFNEFGLWVGTEVLRRTQATERATALIRFIKIARKCLELNNFNTAFALVCGLSQAAIVRLRLSWGKVTSKWMRRFEHMTKLFDSGHNHRCYREVLSKSTLPIIPYVAYYAKTLVAIEELNTWLAEVRIRVCDVTVM